MIFSKPITEIIKNRFSCRTYLEDPIEPKKRQLLQDYSFQLQRGPLSTQLRFGLIAAGESDRDSLKDLGTYGFIKNAGGFLVGLMTPDGKDLEDFGYVFEKLILYATDLDLGTCWLGGTFTKSSFAQKIDARPEERMPAVASIGYIPDVNQARKTLLRQNVKADTRLPWEVLFFDQDFETPLIREKAGAFAIPLDMVRWGPSASNKQPWRILQGEKAWHFYLYRTKGYHNFLLKQFMQMDDLQRVDLGIAMCHFELTAQELGLKGHWAIQEPEISLPDQQVEYTISWIED